MPSFFLLPSCVLGPPPSSCPIKSEMQIELTGAERGKQKGKGRGEMGSLSLSSASPSLYFYPFSPYSPSRPRGMEKRGFPPFLAPPSCILRYTKADAPPSLSSRVGVSARPVAACCSVVKEEEGRELLLPPSPSRPRM